VRAAEAARQNVAIATDSLALANKSLTAAKRMVEESLRTNRDVLEAMDDLTRDDTALVTSKINYYLAVVRLRRAMGLDISKDLPTERVEEPAGATEQPAEASEANDVSEVTDVPEEAEVSDIPDVTAASDASDVTDAPEVSTE